MANFRINLRPAYRQIASKWKKVWKTSAPSAPHA